MVSVGSGSDLEEFFDCEEALYYLICGEEACEAEVGESDLERLYGCDFASVCWSGEPEPEHYTAELGIEAPLSKLPPMRIASRHSPASEVQLPAFGRCCRKRGSRH